MQISVKKLQLEELILEKQKWIHKVRMNYTLQLVMLTVKNDITNEGGMIPLFQFTFNSREKTTRCLNSARPLSWTGGTSTTAMSTCLT